MKVAWKRTPTRCSASPESPAGPSPMTNSPTFPTWSMSDGTSWSNAQRIAFGIAARTSSTSSRRAPPFVTLSTDVNCTGTLRVEPLIGLRAGCRPYLEVASERPTEKATSINSNKGFGSRGLIGPYLLKRGSGKKHGSPDTSNVKRPTPSIFVPFPRHICDRIVLQTLRQMSIIWKRLMMSCARFGGFIRRLLFSTYSLWQCSNSFTGHHATSSVCSRPFSIFRFVMLAMGCHGRLGGSLVLAGLTAPRRSNSSAHSSRGRFRVRERDEVLSQGILLSNWLQRGVEGRVFGTRYYNFQFRSSCLNTKFIDF